jgi:hypothetical protein
MQRLFFEAHTWVVRGNTTQPLPEFAQPCGASSSSEPRGRGLGDGSV